MSTDTISYILESRNRKKIVQTIFEYPRRQWSCSALEDITHFSHATVYRTLAGLRKLGLLKSLRVNKKDIVYQLVIDSLLIPEIKKILMLEANTARRIATIFARKIKMGPVRSILLYGSVVRNEATAISDIDILIIVASHDPIWENKIQQIATELSSRYNRIISPLIMDEREITLEKNSQFLLSVKKEHEILHGKEPF